MRPLRPQHVIQLRAATPAALGIKRSGARNEPLRPTFCAVPGADFHRRYGVAPNLARIDRQAVQDRAGYVNKKIGDEDQPGRIECEL